MSLDDLSDRFVSPISSRRGGQPRRPRLDGAGQDHARGRVAPAAGRRDRARRAAAGLST